MSLMKSCSVFFLNPISHNKPLLISHWHTFVGKQAFNSCVSLFKRICFSTWSSECRHNDWKFLPVSHSESWFSLGAHEVVSSDLRSMKKRAKISVRITSFWNYELVSYLNKYLETYKFWIAEPLFNKIFIHHQSALLV